MPRSEAFVAALTEFARTCPGRESDSCVPCVHGGTPFHCSHPDHPANRVEFEVVKGEEVGYDGRD